MTQNTTYQSGGSDKSRMQRRLPILSKIAHELKTPIHGIRGILSYLLENWEAVSDSEKRKHIKAVMEAGDNLNELLKFLPMSEDAGDGLGFRFEKINMPDVIRSAIDKYKALNSAKEPVNIELETECDECYVEADAFWISQLLMNLMSNAVNYSKGGRIIILVRKEIEDSIEVCAVSVQDEGIGIGSEELSDIFNPFYRGSNNLETKGSGIGLAICREITRAHGGRIHASNNPGVGSTVKFYVPIS